MNHVELLRVLCYNEIISLVKKVARMPETIVDIVACISSAVLFLLLTDLRYDIRGSFAAGIGGCLVLSGFFGYAVMTGVPIAMATGFTMTLPSLLLMRVLSKSGRWPFLFTFCTVDSFTLVVYFISQAAFAITGKFFVYVLCMAAGHVLLYVLAYHVREPYRRVQRSLKSGWNILAIASAFFYMMFYLLAGYPAPLSERPEYIPTMLFFCTIVLVMYMVAAQLIKQLKMVNDYHKDERLLRTQLDLKSSQLEVQQLYYRLAYIDTMTGLKNRTAFEERKQELEKDWESRCPAACICLDLNNLKQTNDRLGHLVGDKLIQAGASVLRSVLPGLEEVYRIGGDEFLVLLCNTTGEQADRIYRQILHAVEHYNERRIPKIDIAIGMEKTNTESFDELFDLADKKMYENKKMEKCRS